MHFRNTVIASLVATSFAMGASASFGQGLTHVPSANPRIVGVTSPTVLSPELAPKSAFETAVSPVHTARRASPVFRSPPQRA